MYANCVIKSKELTIMNSSEDQDGNLHQLMQGRICVEIQMRNHPTQQRLDLLNWEENWKEYKACYETKASSLGNYYLVY